MAADVCWIYPYALSERGILHTMSLYVDGGGAGTGDTHVKCVIYSDDAGAADALLATSAEAHVTDSQAAGWVDLALTRESTCPAATYWLGFIADNNIRSVYCVRAYWLGRTPGRVGQRHLL